MTVAASSERRQSPEHRSIDQSKIAYQKPQPADMVPDVFVGSALQPDLSKLVGWPFGDFIFHTESDVISNFSKIYEFGFTERMDSTKSLIAALDSLKRQEVLP